MLRTAVRSLVAAALATALAFGLAAPASARPASTMGQGCCLAH